MFEGLSEAAVVDTLAAAARAENAQCARRLAAIGELYVRRAPEDDDERFQWAIDGHENVVAEVSAALRMSRNRAAAQLDCAIALRGLPKIAEVFASGEIDFRVMSTIVARTKNIEDPEVLTSGCCCSQMGFAVDEAVQAEVAGADRLVGGQVRCSGRAAASESD